VERNAVNPQFWFVIGRVGGLAAWLLLAAAMVCGLAQSSRRLGALTVGRYAFALYQRFSILSVVFVVIHILGLLANTTLNLHIADLLVPFFSTFEPREAVAWGVIAFWLLLAIQISARLRKNVSEKMWVYIHASSFLLFLLADVHSLTLGFDISNPTVKLVAISFSYLVLFGLLVRFSVSGYRTLTQGRSGGAPRLATAAAGAPGAGAAVPAGTAGGQHRAAHRTDGPAAQPPSGNPGPRSATVAAMAMPPRPGPPPPMAPPLPVPMPASAPVPRPAAPMAPPPAAAPPASIDPALLRFYPLQIVDVHQETADATTIAFAVPPQLVELFRFGPGQYVTLRTVRDGREIRRSYSICSGIADGELRVAVKRVEHGQISNWLSTWLQPNAVVEVQPPAGTFTIELNPLRARHLLGVAAGIGMAPVISIAKSVLRVEPRGRCTLIYSSRDESSVVFRDELNWMQQKYAGRLRVLHVLSKEGSRDQDGPALLRGRLTASKLHALAAWGVDMRTVDDAFVCAPDRMTAEICQALVQLGVAPASVRRERYESSEPGMDQIQAALPGYPPPQLGPGGMPQPGYAAMGMPQAGYAPAPAQPMQPMQPVQPGVGQWTYDAAGYPVPSYPDAGYAQPMPTQPMPVQPAQGYPPVQPAAYPDPTLAPDYVDQSIANLPSPYPEPGYGQAGYGQAGFTTAAAGAGLVEPGYAPAELAPGGMPTPPMAAPPVELPAAQPPGAASGEGLTVMCNGQASSLPVDPGKTVLDAGLAAGLDLPYSCKAGFCGACRAAVVQGEFDPGNASAEPGYVYTCQAKPLGPGAAVNFDA
jgi:ring-1,2-phenylacetyl-CoA epoxidase subunit PaaE